MKLFLALLALLALLAATPAGAGKGDLSIGARFGSSLPISDFSRSTEPGLVMGLHGTSMASEHMGVGLDLAYHSWDLSRAASSRLTSLLGPGWSLAPYAIQTTAHVHAETPLGNRVSPYAEVGMGLYWMNATISGPTLRARGDSQSHLSYRMGAGVRFHIGPTFDLDIDGSYHIINSDAASVPAARLFTLGVGLVGSRRAR